MTISLFVLGTTVPAWADLIPLAGSPVSRSSGAAPRSAAAGQPEPAAEYDWGESQASQPANIDAESGTVRALPSTPGSAALFLWAMGTMGAWQLTRSAKRLHLGAVPQWFHTGGPQQIGHAKALTSVELISVFASCWPSQPRIEHVYRGSDPHQATPGLLGQWIPGRMPARAPPV